MDSNSGKRRKLSHPSGSLSIQNGRTSTPGASVFLEAVDDLLKDEKVVDSNLFHDVDDNLRQLKGAIESLEPHESLPIADVTKKFEKENKMKIPYPDPRPEKASPYKLSFAKPAQVNVVGSYQLKTLVKTQNEIGIDMIVVMPTTLFQEKDFLNFRYFYKRAYYLAYMTAGIRKSFESSMTFTFENMHENPLLPVLVARPQTLDAGSTTSGRKMKYAMRIIPCAPEGIFPAAKLSPKSSSIRQGADTEKEPRPTPFYNATLKAEMLYTQYLRLLNSTAKSCPSFKDACVLGRIWLAQRGFGGNISDGGFGHFEFAVLVALLLQGGGRKGEALLSPSLSAPQIWRATIQFLASTHFQKKPCIFGSSPKSLETVRQTGPVLYDAARELNVLWKTTPWSAKLLQQHAKWSLAGLKADDSLDQFDSLFIVKANQPLHLYDVLVRIKMPSSVESTDCRGLSWAFGEKLYNVLKKALSDRASLIHITLPQSDEYPISNGPSASKSRTALVGIILDPQSAGRMMDRGPSVEDDKKAAEKYREFWGERAELRRFKDGGILESVSWDTDTGIDPEMRIIQYICKLHLNLGHDDIEIYPGMKTDSSHMQNYSAAKRALESLERDIRDLEDLPLHVRQIAGTCPQLRYASLDVPSPGKHPVSPMDVVISFEQSGKWPDNLAAIQEAKIAFLLKIGTSLEESKDEIKTHIGLENAGRDIENLAFLDVVYDGGFAFRLRVQSDVEERELENMTKNKTLPGHVQTEASSLLATCKHLYTHLPLHTAAFSTYCTRFPALSPSVRLVKQWFCMHKLACHFSEELLELFTLEAFRTTPTPSSASTGFFRTMRRLARWDWRDQPLIVDFSENISTEQRSAIFSRFRECRRLDPRLNKTVLFVATSQDDTGTVWTRQGPSRVVANQMTRLARSVCDAVKDKSIDFDPRTLFLSSTRHYDFIIKLNSKVIRSVLRDDGTKHSHFRNLDAHNASEAIPLIEHPTKLLLRRLKALYSAPLVFFHGGDPDDYVIGALWNPEIGTRTRKVDMPCAFRPLGREATLEVDRQTILGEIARVSGDLIAEIMVKDDGKT